jgi:3-hydroxyisobutyrate/3-hydroxypropionate dehydrogenase
MGFPMAANLRRKIPKESVLYINDVDIPAVERFVKEYSSVGPIEICSTAKEITDKSVLAARIVIISGHNFLDCAERIPCPECILRR